MARQIKTVNIIPMPPISWGDDFYKEVSLLKVTLTDGLVGLGGAYTSATELQKIWDEYAPLLDLQSLDLKQIAGWVSHLCAAGAHKANLNLIPALSALDIAIWDLHGHAAQQSIASLLGGATAQRIKAYASLEIPLPRHSQDFDDFQIHLQTMLDQNFKAIKLYFPRLGYRNKTTSNQQNLTPQEWQKYEAALFQRARAVVGPDIDLMLDVFGSADDWAGSFAWAEQTAAVLVEQGFLWFEEPFRPDDILSYTKFAAQAPLHISACEFFTDPQELVRWANSKAVAILQPDCTCSGGISTLVQVRDAALENGLTMIPHGWSTAVGMAADIQVMATLPQGPLRMVEYMPRPSVTDLLDNKPFALDEEGMITISTAPGLGVSLSHWSFISN